MKKLTVIVAALALGLALASSALADSLTDAYGGKAGAVQTSVKGAVTKVSQPAVKSDTAGSLPFTGLDLTLIVGGAVVLVLAGFGVRRAARDKS